MVLCKSNPSGLGISWFLSFVMGFLAMNALVGLPEGTDSGLYILYDGKSDAFLTDAGVTTDRAQFAHARQR